MKIRKLINSRNISDNKLIVKKTINSVRIISFAYHNKAKWTIIYNTLVYAPEPLRTSWLLHPYKESRRGRYMYNNINIHLREDPRK